MTRTISSISTRLHRIPLLRPWGPDVRELSVVVVALTDSEGAVGHGFSWTPSIGAASVRAMLETEIRSFVLGRSAEPGDRAELWRSLWTHLHEAGGGGVTTIAIAGVDLALWDLDGVRAGSSVVDLIGRRRESVEVYGSGVNLHYTLDELVAQATRWVDGGYRAVKMKVGSPEPARDIERVRAVRDVIGPDRVLRVDANQRWTYDQAVRAIDALAPFDIDWVEEPLRADDLIGYRRLHAELSASSAVPIACGENIHSAYRFADFIDQGAADILQPNVVRVGGITPFLSIAADAEQAGLVLAPHLLLELSGQLALALPQETSVEDVEDAGFLQLGALTTSTPVSVSADARLVFDARPGLGIDFADHGGSDAHPHRTSSTRPAETTPPTTNRKVLVP